MVDVKAIRDRLEEITERWQRVRTHPQKATMQTGDWDQFMTFDVPALLAEVERQAGEIVRLEARVAELEAERRR